MPVNSRCLQQTHMALFCLPHIVLHVSLLGNYFIISILRWPSEQLFARHQLLSVLPVAVTWRVLNDAQYHCLLVSLPLLFSMITHTAIKISIVQQQNKTAS